ncbi:hypothetical protein [Lignipirellula cremea]|uniref:Uncharacterized protein n=1 Tax=Lignipirellula cremea TaxID=2528010 RepID=A0A518DQX1_9BACT|nr:hypothetical protein [Lignipirellula cremea]QDU94231.1 hypothetical protein Pla8534_20190 [Lignipirellula cremea]
MAAPNRASLITKTQKVLKKHFEAVHPPADRLLLEHWLYASVLEDAPGDKADEAFARLQEDYFELNEVRVTTVTELAETFSCLPQPESAGKRVRAVLQAVFEADYNYDLEPLKKQNIGKAIKHLEAYQTQDGASITTPFALAYVTQHALGGHSIPIDQSGLQLLFILGVITESEAEKKQTPGLERAIPKNKGIEFASQLHQFSSEFALSPQSTKLRTIIAEINAEAKDRLPKRKTKKEEEAEAEAAEAAEAKATRKKRAAKKPPAAPVSEAAPAKKSSTKKSSKKTEPKGIARKKPR